MKILLGLSLLALFSVMVIPAYAEVMIVEVESNPEGEDSGAEWAKLFNSGEKSVSLTGWGIASNQDSHSLSGSIGACGEKIVTFDGEFLDNESDSLILHDSAGLVISSTYTISDEKDDSFTWKTKSPVCESEIEQAIEEPIIEEPIVASMEEEPVITEEENKDEGLDFGISVEQNENFDYEFMSIMPYFVLAGIGIIGAIAIIVVKNKQKNDEEIPEEKDRSVIETMSLSKKFQEMQVDTPKDMDVEFQQIILDKVQKIEVLQENNFGDQKKLESIKTNLNKEGFFTKKESDYVESQYEQYTKQNEESE